MTAETLKPFITPRNTADNFAAIQSANATCSQRKHKLITIGLSCVVFAFLCTLLGFTIWNIVRVQNLKTELSELSNVVENLKKKLGINYLDDLSEYDGEDLSDTLIDDPDDVNLDIEDNEGNIILDYDNDMQDDYDDEDDSDDDNAEDEDDTFFDETKFDNEKKNASAQDNDNDSSGQTSGSDDLLDDFQSYQDSKKKKSERTQRSIAELYNEMQRYDESFLSQENKSNNAHMEQSQTLPTNVQHKKKSNLHLVGLANRGSRQFVAERRDAHHSPLRMRTSRRRKIPLVKSGESLISAKTPVMLTRTHSAVPAVHFHLNRKISHHNAPIKLDSYAGDIYIGHASTANDNGWQLFFHVDNGILTIRETGLYYVYAQICYNNTHDQNGFVIFHGHKPFLQCLNTVPTNMPLKIHTCHTSGLIHLQENETIHLRDFHSDRNAILKDANNRSFFGIIKV